ncbi:MAG: YggT family protein [Anaerolineales bacterium]|nr:YggT family protein [Anaerolineales bacterium]MCA9931108.1 YggT family protein [Anaerolineales bacterium]
MTILITTINLFFQFLTILIFVRIIFSWIRVDPYHPTWGPILRFVYQITDPIMEPVRRIMPPMGGFDFSPIIVLFGLNFLNRLLISILVGF